MYETRNACVGRSTAGLRRLSLNIPREKRPVGFLRARTLSQKTQITRVFWHVVCLARAVATIAFDLALTQGVLRDDSTTDVSINKNNGSKEISSHGCQVFSCMVPVLSGIVI